MLATGQKVSTAKCVFAANELRFVRTNKNRRNEIFSLRRLVFSFYCRFIAVSISSILSAMVCICACVGGLLTVRFKG